MNQAPLVTIRNLTKDYVSRGGFFGRSEQRVRVLEKLNLTIYEGETLGIVGESGCGKSTLANTLLRLIPATEGEVVYDGENILTIDAVKLRKLRQHFQMVFQNPFSSLNPRLNVLNIVSEPLLTHTNLGKDEATSACDHFIAGMWLKRRPSDALSA